MAHDAQSEVDRKEHKEKKQCFTFFVDDRQFEVAEPTITGQQIMNLAGIPREVGIVLILDDGTQQAVNPEQVIDLAKCKQFRKAPRFKRG